MRLAIPIVALAAAASPALAQRDFSNVEIRAERIAPGVAVLFGRGGNIGLSHGEDGNLLIDDQFAPLTDRIVAAVQAIDPDPVRYVVNTHWHSDHVGGNENLGKAGAVILAHSNVRERMSTEQARPGGRTIPPSPKAALPVVTYDWGVTLHVNGDSLHVIHVANAHTDGDSLVHWEKANVLHMGDTFFHRFSLPFIDTGSGGSIDGLIAAVDKGLALSGPDTKIIPGHGPMAGRDDLAAYRAMLADLRAKVAAGIAAGQSLEQIQKSDPAAPYGPKDGFIKPDQLVAAIHSSLVDPPVKAKADHGHAH